MLIDLSFSICVALHFQELKWKEDSPEKTPLSRDLTLGPLTAMKPLASSDGFGPSSADKSKPAPVHGAPGPQQCPPLLPAASHLQAFSFWASPGHCQGSAGG